MSDTAKAIVRRMHGSIIRNGVKIKRPAVSQAWNEIFSLSRSNSWAFDSIFLVIFVFMSIFMLVHVFLVHVHIMIST